MRSQDCARKYTRGQARQGVALVSLVPHFWPIVPEVSIFD